MKHRLAYGCALIALIYTGAGIAGETIAYKYDAKGRLVEVKRTGTINNNVTTGYQYDKADNRQNVTTTGSSNGAPTPPPPPSPPMTALNPSETLTGATLYSLPVTKFEQNGVSPAVQSFNIPAGGGLATIASGGSSVNYSTPYANEGADACTRGTDKSFQISVGVSDTSTSVTSAYTVTIPGIKGTRRPCD